MRFAASSFDLNFHIQYIFLKIFRKTLLPTSSNVNNHQFDTTVNKVKGFIRNSTHFPGLYGIAPVIMSTILIWHSTNPNYRVPYKIYVQSKVRPAYSKK